MKGNLSETLETKYRRERASFFRNLARLDRRSFLRVASASALAAASAGMGEFVGSFQPVEVQAQEADGNRAARPGFRFAYISDSHLYVRQKNDRFANALMRAVDDINHLPEQPDFVLYGGDLAQLGQAEELELGAAILGQLKAPLRIIPGEHDWYYDMGEKWQALFGSPNWSFDHKGVHFVAVFSVLEEDFWTPRGMSPMERMKTVAGLDNRLQNPFTVGEANREWLRKDLENVRNDTPVIVFSHSPLYKLYRNWNFWTDDAEEVQAILRRFDHVTVLHGHTHQMLTNRIGNIAFHGMLSTAWPWPYAPEGLPKLCVEMNRAEPFNVHDGCGDGEVVVNADGLCSKVYDFWNRDPMVVSARYVASDGTEDQPPMANAGSY